MKITMKYCLMAGASAALLATTTAAHAAVIQAPPIATRVAQSTTIVVGKVESIEEKAVTAKRNPNDADKGEFQIAVIKIDDPILAAKGLTHVRVGFQPPPDRPVIRPGGYRPVSFVKDQEVLVFLAPHFDGNFLYANAYYDAVNKQGNQNFEKDVAEAKRFAQLLANPKEGLKSDKAEDRYATAAVLIQHYRFKRLNVENPKTEAVDAELSKLILTTLADADWTNANNTIPRLTPAILFGQLGLTDKDGWTPPMKEVMGNKVDDFEAQPAAMKQWLKDNAAKYRIQRFVYDKAEKSDK